ncbi:MAG: SGNH/GDSL hydrolase family protein, partial [Elusimicrobia bacterium]|nr:SGNH/GDSL hydrolase family protein [Elusimicrobiota bacterium]
GRPPSGHNFDVQFLDMYDRAFRRARHDGAAVYESVRPRLNPARFPVRKPPGRRRIFLIGDSTAWSFPGGLLEGKLQEVLPGAEFEVVNCGMPGSDAYRNLLMGREVLGYDPDLVVVIAGNNEMIGPRRLNPWKYRGPLSHSAVFRLLCDLVSPAVTIRSREEADRYFSDSLSRLAAAAAARRVPLLLCTEPANYRDNHFPDEGMSFEPDFLALIEALRRRESGAAARRLEALAGRHPDSAFLEHYRGRLAEDRGDHAAAARHYALALERDPFPIVCDRRCNGIIRSLAAQYGLPLADIAQRFLDTAPHGIPGFDLFKDNCHAWPPVFGLYADEITEAVRGFDCARGAFALASCGDWRMDQLSRTTYVSLAGPVAGQKAQTGAEGNLVFALTMILGPGPHSLDPLPLAYRAFQYLDLLHEQAPETLRTLDARRAECLALLDRHEWVAGLAGDLRQESGWGRVLAYAGETLRRAGRLQDALRLFDKAVACDGRDAMARYFRGWTCLGLGRRREAAADFAAARGLNPWLGTVIPGTR